jgi:two-component system phosphate regulon sensor histidine kinase PhoR
MQRDLWRLFAVLIAAAAVGTAAGEPAIGLMLGALLYAGWQQRNLIRLLRWLQDRKTHPAPDAPGLFEAICREVDYLRARHRRRKRKIVHVLKQFQDATEALPDATVILDKGGEIKWANRAASEFLGVRWPDDEKQRLVNLIRDPAVSTLLGDETPHENTVEIPSPVKPDRYLSLRVVPYTEDQRLFVARDVTRLHGLDQMRRDFVANVSHELRTPLTVISGYIQTLRADETRCPEAWKPVLAQIDDHARRMTSVIRELLLLSRLEQDDKPPAANTVAIRDLVARIHGDAQALSGERRHMFSLEIEPNLQLVGDEGELHSAFANLVTNAVQYTPERGIIRIRWYADEAGVHFAVEDNGIGIPAQHLPRITERFYRVDQGRSRDSGGTGLGLAIVKHVLNRHDATLHVESQSGKGSLFRCDFPLSRLAAPAAIGNSRTGQ